jgi:hypothetical protein
VPVVSPSSPGAVHSSVALAPGVFWLTESTDRSVMAPGGVSSTPPDESALKAFTRGPMISGWLSLMSSPVLIRSVSIWSSVRPGLAEATRPITPETCGAAIDVPESVPLPPTTVLSTLLPGAAMSTHEP